MVWPQTIKNIIIRVILSALAVLMLLLEGCPGVSLKSRLTVACPYLWDGTAWEHVAAPLPLGTALRAVGVRSVQQPGAVDGVSTCPC